jgi:hypothetical protein
MDFDERPQDWHGGDSNLVQSVDKSQGLLLHLLYLYKSLGLIAELEMCVYVEYCFMRSSKTAPTN